MDLNWDGHAARSMAGARNVPQNIHPCVRCPFVLLKELIIVVWQKVNANILEGYDLVKNPVSCHTAFTNAEPNKNFKI